MTKSSFHKPLDRLILTGTFIMTMLLSLLMLNSASYGRLSYYVGSPQLMNLLQNVKGADGYSFNLMDDKHIPMDTAKIIGNPLGTGYLAVYHHFISGSYQVRLATSKNLSTWHYVVTLESHASQATIASLSDGGFLVGYEKNEMIQKAETGRSNVAFKYYSNLNALLRNKPTKAIVFERSLSSWSEGTPNIYSVELKPDINHSVIVIGFHYLDGVDHEGQGVLINCSSWYPYEDTDLNTAFESLGFINGNIGRRDAFSYLGKQYIIVEAQSQYGDFQMFHPYLYDRESKQLAMLDLHLSSGGYGLGNPTFTNIVLPNGGVGFVSTEYVFSGRSSGELLYWKQYPD